MKYILTITIVLILSGCVAEGEDKTSDMTSICLDGVSYWYASGQSRAVLAPRINPETLTYVRCEGNKND
jgi:hypothetical protein